jgi:glutaminase
MRGKKENPVTSPVQDYLQQLHERFARVKDGDVATYIPELAKADPDWFGISLVTAGGSVYEAGDSRQEFTIQSISKPFVYGMALEDNSREAVLKKVGIEPTGDAFNSISLEPGTGRPRNPMINAGAIATAGLIAGKSPETRFRRVLETFGVYAGRELKLDEPVYRSENETGHRNRAISHMLRNFDILTSDPTPVTELYFKQCSISVSCRDLAMMAATLANRGVNPVTGKQAIRGEYVESVLSVMETCGMYDFAGEWVYHVGMPAKSGVAGGVIAVLPGQLGIGVFSPRLDSHGNSVRGIGVCQEISRNLDLHLLNRPTVGRFTVRRKFSAAEFNSNRVRPEKEFALLREHGGRIRVWQLQGNLMFSTAEVLVHQLMENLDADYFILDFKRVLGIGESACHLIYQSLEKLRARGKTMLFAHPARVPLLRRFMHIKLAKRFDEDFRAFDDSDVALEWCENELVKQLSSDNGTERIARNGDYELFENLTPEESDAIRSLLKRRKFKAGEAIIRAGDKADEMFFLSRGSVSVRVPQPEGGERRLATFAPGMSFGEMAMIDRAPRSATIIADSTTECDELTREDFDHLNATHPQAKIKLFKNICFDLSRKLRKANRELGVLD